MKFGDFRRNFGQASEERRSAAVSEARAEILRLEQVELLSETARVRDEIAALQRE